MSMVESVRYKVEDQIGVVELDLVGEKANKFNTEVMLRIKDVVSEIKKSNVKAVIWISRKENIFVAGADIEEIRKMNTKDAFRDAIERAHSIFNSIEDLPMPQIAAINGACAGGGTEFILCCDYRIATEESSTKIGLPEVKIGVIPGFGGCYRLPRKVGIQAALDIILAGKLVPAKKAKKIGLVDEVVPKAILEKRAFEYAKEVIAAGKARKSQVFKPRNMMQKVMEAWPTRSIVFSQAKKITLKQSKGFYPAPLEALKVVKQVYGMSDRKKALAIETDAFCEVAVTDISKNLINLFFMMESVKKETGVSDANIRGKDVDHLGVLGAGVMGGGIGYVSANADITTRMKDISNEAIALGLRSAHAIWKKKLKRKRLTQYEYEQKASHLSGGLDWAGFRSTDVVVEAIVEDMNIKKKVIGEAAAQCSPECIMATNTSSLSVSEMSKGHPNPRNFLGMHFFNPVDKMPLVEVIRGEQTSDEAVATIFELSKKLGKIPVVVKDGPGFLVNRLLLPYMGEALFLLEDGMSIETLDRYFTHKHGMPMGPFRLLDEVGLDVGIKVLKIFRESLGERIEIADTASKLAETDRLGKKNNRGFYLYDDKGKDVEVDQSIYKELGLKTPTDPLDEKECIERPMFQMINEAATALLDEKIVGSPAKLDLAMIMGTGFPPFRGGLLKWADEVGSKYVADQLEVYAAKYGRRFKPLSALENLAKSERTFY